MKAIKTCENEIKSSNIPEVLYCLLHPQYSLFEILCSPKHKHSNTDQRPPGNSFIDDTPYSLSTCSTTPESTKITFYIK